MLFVFDVNKELMLIPYTPLMLGYLIQGISFFRWKKNTKNQIS